VRNTTPQQAHRDKSRTGGIHAPIEKVWIIQRDWRAPEAAAAKVISTSNQLVGSGTPTADNDPDPNDKSVR
jgi:hypothetical protein